MHSRRNVPIKPVKRRRAADFFASLMSGTPWAFLLITVHEHLVCLVDIAIVLAFVVGGDDHALATIKHAPANEFREAAIW